MRGDSSRRPPSCPQQFRTKSLDGFGLEQRPLAVRAGGALVRYLRDTQKADLAHVRTASFRQASDTLLVDPVTLKNLEVVESSAGGRAGSLLDEIDRTVTAMGGRLLRQWLLRPLLSLERVRDRLDAVEDFAFKTTERGRFRETLKSVQDLERLVARTALGAAGPRNLVALKQSLGAVPRLRMIQGDMQSPLVRSLAAELDDVPEVRTAIDAALIDEPPALARDGGFVRDGFDPALDELRQISRSGKQLIAQMEEQERARTGISSLKVRFNRVFGYYIEVSKSNLHAVPPDYHRKQTIVGGERYITPALKEYEEKVLGADERSSRGKSISSKRCAPGWPLTLRASRIRRARSPRSMPSRRLPKRRPSATTPSPTCTRATSCKSSTGGTRSWSAVRPTPSCRTTRCSTAPRTS